MKWPKTHGHFTHTNRTHARTLNTHELNKHTNKTKTHTLLADLEKSLHTHGLPETAGAAGSCWNYSCCRKLLELLAIEEAAGTVARVSIETASGCWNAARSRKLLELLAIQEAAAVFLVHRSRPRLAAGNCSRLGSCWCCCSCVATAHSSDCCSCLWNPGFNSVKTNFSLNFFFTKLTLRKKFAALAFEIWEKNSNRFKVV